MTSVGSKSAKKFSRKKAQKNFLIFVSFVLFCGYPFENSV